MVLHRDFKPEETSSILVAAFMTPRAFSFDDQPLPAYNPVKPFDPQATYTYRELFAPAMEITDQERASNYFARLVEYDMQKWGKTRDESEQRCRQNLGYYAGYYSHEDRDRVERLFGVHHPVFGAIAQDGVPTPEEAFRLGMEAGARMREANVR
jgi:hypothetical protein